MKTLCALLIALLIPESLSQSACEESTASKIVGGYETDSEKHPFYTALVLSSQLKSNGSLLVVCGASLIKSNKILTAAHCYADRRKKGGNWMSELSAVFDLKNRCKGEYGASSSIIRVEIHPLYDPLTTNNDLAIATLSRNVLYDPVCLAPKGGGGISSAGYVVGYGATTEGGKSQPCKLMRAGVKIFPKNECLQTEIKQLIKLVSGIVCAGLKSGIHDTCQGDSGGPLVRFENGIEILQGLTSFGRGCGRANSPGVYTDVSYHRDWIDAQIGTSFISSLMRGSRCGNLRQTFGFIDFLS
ncbi:uncharacterized protein LOC106668680 [Cimex lectularius]|uniref:Peptidase S1 domain-containing protein n=1 Tax=Cimex lectularius TaxID=79782 RepID=A0A8I6RXG1_CIMLE|nr:uncharacterized protein LOC106668680 [Cimex lectularius]